MKVPSRTRQILIICCGIFIVATSGGWLYSRNSLFRLSEIDVVCDNPELSSHLRHQLIPFLGQSLFSVSMHDIERRVLLAPAVDRLSLHRSWPSKIVIEVQLRDPIAMTFFNGELWGLDKEGRSIELLRNPQPLPLVKGFFPPSTDPQNAQSAQTEVFSWLDRMQKQEDGASFDVTKISEIDWNTNRGLVVKIFELGLEIELGSYNFSNAWMKAVRALDYLNSKGLTPEFLDATYRSRVVARMHSKLQNSQNGLNLEELVRRRGLMNGAEATAR